MYRGGKICLSAHFKPLWARNVPHFGIAHALILGLAPWLAAEIPHLVETKMIAVPEHPKNEDEENGDPDEQMDIETEHRLLVWKKNIPYLYDICLTYVSDWPVLTIDWSTVIQKFKERECIESVDGFV